MNEIIFDIETIPQENLTTIQEEELQKRMEGKDPSLRNLTMATNPYFGQIICIGLMKTIPSSSLFDTVALTGSEEEILNKFWYNINEHQGVFISFNGLNFDIPFILKRSMKYNICPTNKSFLDVRRFSKFPHFDVKLILGDWDKYAPGTLRLIADYLGLASPKEGEIKAENVADAFKEGKIKEIADYCLKDVLTTYKIYNRIKLFVK